MAAAKFDGSGRMAPPPAAVALAPLVADKSPLAPVREFVAVEASCKVAEFGLSERAHGVTSYNKFQHEQEAQDKLGGKFIELLRGSKPSA